MAKGLVLFGDKGQSKANAQAGAKENVQRQCQNGDKLEQFEKLSFGSNLIMRCEHVPLLGMIQVGDAAKSGVNIEMVMQDGLGRLMIF